jgi:hypothetical protein
MSVSLSVAILLFTLSVTVFHITTNRVTTDDLIDKLTYKKNVKDCIINYGLIILGLAIILLKDGSSQRGLTLVSIGVLIQVIILLHSRSFGVSLIWCAILGYILSQKERTMKEKAYIIMCACVIIYYLYRFGLLTTGAHVGSILGSIWLSRYV